MENSVTLMSRAHSCKHRTMDSCDEESSWTMYFEDFLDSEEQSSFSPGFESPSLMSDAASSAANKCSMNQNNEEFSLDKSIIKMRCKKRMKIVDDSELEDTASSPVSSSKVFKLNQNERCPKFRQARDLAFVGRAGDYCTDLKKRGLCLVPVSMMANYIS